MTQSTPTPPHRLFPEPNRRSFLASAATAPLAIAAATRAAGDAAPALERDAFEYEIQRSEAEWRALLNDAEYEILRDGWTELPRTSELWNDTREGHFGCRGCGMHLYSSTWRSPQDKGWVFFAHAEPSAVLMDIDGPQEPYGMNPDGPGALIEAHCRRCGSHLGHILLVDGEVLHCINGTSLTFVPTAT